jgi:hypothetical protein
MHPTFDELVCYLIEQGEAWVVRQRERYRLGATLLDRETRTAFAPFFGNATLAMAHFKAVPAIENPEFYADLQKRGLEAPLDFTRMEGITFIDTVLWRARQG